MHPDDMTQSESIAELVAALVAARADMAPVVKDAVNPHFKSRYASLDAIIDATAPALAKHGLAIIQAPWEIETGAVLITTLAHKSGEWTRGIQLLRPTKNDPQGIGSAMTYARRYGWQSIIGVAADEDDDGNSASRAPKPTQSRPAAKPVSKPKPTACTECGTTDAKLTRTADGWRCAEHMGEPVADSAAVVGDAETPPADAHWSDAIAACDDPAALVDMLGRIDAESNGYRRNGALLLWAKAVADNCGPDELMTAGKAVKAWPKDKKSRGQVLTILTDGYKRAQAPMMPEVDA